MSHAYRLSALKLLSDIELPELLPWDGGCDAPADLHFRLGPVPARLEPAEGCARYLTEFSGEARVLIENGSSVTVELARGADLTDARAVLMAPVQAVLWHQRGLLPLHASAVAIGGKAVALAGPSGSGKSTLAAVLSARGCAVLADDIAIIDADGAVLPGTRRLRLWRDTLDHLGIAAGGLPRALSRREKYLIEDGHGGGPGRHKLAAIMLLSRAPCDGVATERLRGAQGMVALHDIVHMPDAARALGRDPAIFAALARLLNGGVSAWRLVMPDNRACLADAAAEVLAIAGDA